LLNDNSCEIRMFFERLLFHKYLNNKKTIKILINDLNTRIIISLVIKNEINNQIVNNLCYLFFNSKFRWKTKLDYS
jgi:hypothetical protein